MQKRNYGLVFWCWLLVIVAATHEVIELVLGNWSGAVIGALALLATVLVLLPVLSRRRRNLYRNP